MATKLKVTFSNDPTGMDMDITEEVLIPSNVCLYCNHDSRLHIDRIRDEVKKSLEYKGYDLDWCFTLFKAYVI
jgi:hypothetical protein